MNEGAVRLAQTRRSKETSVMSFRTVGRFFEEEMGLLQRSARGRTKKEGLTKGRRGEVQWLRRKRRGGVGRPNLEDPKETKR